MYENMVKEKINLKREYCCVNCGLIWFDEKTSINLGIICPECNNDGQRHDLSIFACDTTGWFYASEGAVASLKLRNKKIHYSKDHPWYGKEQ